MERSEVERQSWKLEGADQLLLSNATVSLLDFWLHVRRSIISATNVD